MAALRHLDECQVMATPWRRRRLCVLVADRPAPAALREINALGARLETPLRPPLGAEVELRHPEAGRIIGRVSTVSPEEIGVAFEGDQRSVAFALAAIAADMSRPAARD